MIKKINFKSNQEVEYIDDTLYNNIASLMEKSSEYLFYSQRTLVGTIID